MVSTFTLPQPDALAAGMGVSKSSAEGANYFATGFERRLERSKIKDDILDKQLQQIKTFAQYITMQFEAANKKTWSGQFDSNSSFKNLQKALSEEAVKGLLETKAPEEDYTFIHAVNDSGQVLRAWDSVQPIENMESSPVNAESPSQIGTQVN